MTGDSPHSIRFPLDEFIERLQLAGFKVTAGQRLRLWQVLRDFGLESLGRPEALKYRLCPVVAASPREQEDFYRLFDKYLQDLRQEGLSPKTETPSWRQRLPNWAWAALLLPLLAAAVYALWPEPARFLSADHPPEAAIGDTVFFANRSVGYDTTATTFRWEMRDAQTDSLETSAETYDWRLPLTAQGAGPEKEIRLIAGAGAEADTLRSRLVLLCADRPGYRAIDAPASVALDSLVRFSLAEPVEDDLRYAWDFGDGNRAEGYMVNHTYTEEGVYEVVLRITRPGVEGDCRQTLTHQISAGWEQAFLAFKSPEEDTAPPILYFNLNFWLLLALLALAALYQWYRWWRQPPPEPEEEKKAQALTERFARTDRAPYTIPFRTHDHQVRAGADLYRLANVLRQRQEGLRTELDVPASVRETIEGGGFPTLRLRRTTVPPSYLFLIDEQAPHSHQAQLYRYLLDFLRGQDVHIAAFWYKKDPARFWNEQHPGGLSLEQLRRRYPYHRLLLLGDAHHLLDPFAREQPGLRPGYDRAYRQWKSRLLLTPLPANDWTYREAALYGLFPVFPSDAEGVQAAMAFLETETEEEDERAMPDFAAWQAAHNLPPLPPETNYRRWNRPETYEDYFRGRPGLLDWFRALAVYPTPTWPLTLAIGHAIGAPVSFDNLLLLARLPWLQGKPMPPRLRLRLLAGLDPETERRARAALAAELEVVAPAVKNSHANRELQTSLALQQFLLNPDDPDRRDAIRHLLDGRGLNPREQAELESALQRQHSEKARAGLGAFLETAPGAKPRPRRPRNRRFYRALALSVLILLLGLAAGFLNGSDTLRRLLGGAQPEAPRENFLVKETLRPDSAVLYNNLGVAAWRTVRDNPEAWQADSLDTAVDYFWRAIAYRNGDYPLATANLARTRYNGSVFHYHAYLQQPDSTQLQMTTDSFRANVQSTILYVKEGSQGNGHSWSSAFGDLQEAFRKARPGTEIWVAAGLYTPTQGDDRSVSFVIPDSVALFGGFIGRERSRDQRDWRRNQTVLSGEIGTPSMDDNSFSVVVTRNVTRKTIVDGFTISGGAANGSGEIGNPERSGAGWFNDGSNGASHPTIVNCLFTGNIARDGAGLYNYAANGSCMPDIINSRFVRNVADLDGGAIYNDGRNGICSPRITNCLFDQNESMYGAGIMNTAPHGEARPVITESTFTRNVSSVKGASIFSNLSEKGTCEVILFGCRFSDNVSSLGNGNDVTGAVQFGQPQTTKLDSVKASKSKATFESQR